MQIELKLISMFVLAISCCVGVKGWTDGHYWFENFFVSYNTLVAMN